jgi:hypothetical protein
VSRTTTCLRTQIYPHAEELADPAFRKTILDDFGKQLTIVKSSLDIGKDVSKMRPPYTRKPIPSPTVSVLTRFPPQLSGGARNGFRNQWLGGGTDATNRTPCPCQKPISVLTAPSVEDKLRLALCPEKTATNSLGRGCLGGTRKALLSDITAWFNDSSAPNILWLCGAPGTGKTTISYSLVEGLKRQLKV